MFFRRHALLSAIVIFSAAAASSAQIGSVYTLQGEATLTRDGKALTLSKGSQIESEDIVTTAPTGIVEIRFADQSMVTVGADSQLIIDQFVYNPNAPADNRSALRVGSGFFHFVSGKLARDKVTIETPVSTIGIRGTELAGEVSADGSSMVSLVDCCVDVSNESGTTSLERIGTCSWIKSRRQAPGAPVLTPDYWAERATVALGKSREELGLAQLDDLPYSEPEKKRPHRLQKPEKLEKKYELGPDNRVSFPFIE